jgi:hypothetical protein
MKTTLRTLSLLFLFLALAIGPRAALAQSSPVRADTTAPKPVNLDFEASEPGQPPAGWLSTVAGYRAETSTAAPKSGKRCAVLYAPSPASGFGVLMQTVDAAPYRGHRLRLSAALRAEGARAQLWLRVDRAGERTGFFDNMMDRPVTAADWQTVEIVGDVDDDAKSLNFGLLMLGGGKAAIDAVTIEDLGRPVTAAEPARPLADRGLANLEAFARLLGYVRHFHPSDEAAATDWDTFAVEGVRRVEGAKAPADLAHELEAIFRPVAPTVRVATSRDRLETPAGLFPPPGAVEVVQWRHQGFGGAAKQGGIYESRRVRAPFANRAIPGGFHDPSKPFVADLPGGVTCAVPLALFADAKGTLPHAARAAAPATPAPLVRYTGNDRATRLADVALAWNVLAHFYPYFDVVQTDWRAELGRALASAATDPSAEAFTGTLRRMVAALHDGHGSVAGPEPSGAAALPVLWGWIENRLVITTVAPAGAQGLAAGDVVETIDGRPSLEVIAGLERLISAATPQWARVRALNELRAGPAGSAVALAVRTAPSQQNTERRTVTLERTTAAATLAEARPEKIAELSPGIFYADLGRIADADFEAALPKLAKARGIVFDLRGYPSVSPAPLTHLTDTPLQSARWNVPILTDPDWTGTPGWNTDGRWDLPPAAPRLKAKVVFLTDGRAISYAESWMGIVEAYKLGEIVGETTAGTNGNINPFALPGGYKIYWTGMKVLKHDGSRHHGVGIAPTVPVSRTIRGVALGRDEQLERAVALAAGTDAPPLACHSVEGLAPLLQPGTILLLGEIHGSRESPAFVANASCLAARAGVKVTIGLEIPDAEAPRVAAYVASPGAAADRAALLAGDFWHRPGQDGRSSRAMLDLIESLRTMARQGYPVRLRLLDHDIQDRDRRDRFMADQVREAAEASPGDLLLVLTGNLHTRTKDGIPGDAQRPNMGAFLVKSLPNRKIVALDVSYAGGEVWSCVPDMEHCGIHPLRTARPGDAEKVVLYPQADAAGFHGYYHVGTMKAAEPALPAS